MYPALKTINEIQENICVEFCESHLYEKKSLVRTRAQVSTRTHPRRVPLTEETPYAVCGRDITLVCRWWERFK